MNIGTWSDHIYECISIVLSKKGSATQKEIATLTTLSRGSIRNTLISMMLDKFVTIEETLETSLLTTSKKPHYVLTEKGKAYIIEERTREKWSEELMRIFETKHVGKSEWICRITLAALCTREGCSVGYITKKIRLSREAVEPRLEALVTLGLATKAHPRGRHGFYTLTEKGREVYHDMIDEVGADTLAWVGCNWLFKPEEKPYSKGVKK